MAFQIAVWKSVRIQWGLSAAIVGGTLLKIGGTLRFPAIFCVNVSVRILDEEDSGA